MTNGRVGLRIAIGTALWFMSLVACGQLVAQQPNQAPATQPPVQVTVQDPTLKNAAEKGVPMNVVSNVADSTYVEAVLIPSSLARRIFGKEVANNYAAVELIVSNKDSNAALIVQSVFLDYSQWLLSGLPGNLPPSPILDKTQKANQPWQVASVESRLVRGELLDAQQWTARNWTIRALTAIGAVGAGFQFPFSADVSRGIAAFNGTVVPGASTLWPDGTVNQLNRISDVGFTTNKVIPKQAADIVVAFFPIDRFLTPTFRKLFLSNPAGFFVPGEMLADPKLAAKLVPLLLPMVHTIDSNIDETNLTGRLLQAFLTPCNSTNAQSGQSPTAAAITNCQLQALFSRISLNSLHVVVSGVMTVNVATVPATIYGVTFKDGNTNSAVWTATGTERDGSISGLYLTGGTPYIVDENGKPIDGITIQKVDDGSTDTQLNFKMTISKCIPSSTKVYFVVAKQSDNSGQAQTTTQTTSGGGKQAQTSANQNSANQNSANQNSANKGNNPSPAPTKVSGVVSTPYEFPLPPGYQCPPEGKTGTQPGSTTPPSAGGGNKPEGGNPSGAKGEQNKGKTEKPGTSTEPGK